MLDPQRCAEIVAEIKALPWERGRSVREHGKVKVTEELRADRCEAVRPLLDEIARALDCDAIRNREHALRMYPPRFSRYAGNGEYKIHTDAAYMGGVRTDLACTLFLTDDYEGGELVIEGVLPGDRPARVKAPAGFAAVYECWRPHWVEPVTAGERIVALTWMQSRVPDAEDRALLGLLNQLIADIETPELSAQERFAKLGAVHQKLLKRWSR